MGNLFKLILFQFLLQGINAGLINKEPKIWNDSVFDSQYGDNYCFRVVRPLINHLNQVDKQIEVHDEMKENIYKLEKELERIKMELKEQEFKTNSKDDLLNARDEQIKDLKHLIYEKDEQIREQFHAQNITFAELKVKDILLKSKDEEFREQVKNFMDLINFLEKQYKELLEAKTESKDIKISELKNAINEKNERISDINAQVSNNSKIVEEKKPQIEDPPPAIEVSHTSPSSEWIVIQRRKDGSVDFDRDWEDYKEGFGDSHSQGEFFIGLEKLHLMTQSKPHELYIEMLDFSETATYAHYDNFEVASEEENFKLISLGKYNGTARDALVKHVGNLFSTQDRDNDDSPDNCAQLYGAWWYSNCGYIYLNANFNTGYGVMWETEEDYQEPLSFVEMKIRPTRQS